MIARDKYLSLLGSFVSYEENEVLEDGAFVKNTILVWSRIIGKY